MQNSLRKVAPVGRPIWYHRRYWSRWRRQVKCDAVRWCFSFYGNSTLKVCHQKPACFFKKKSWICKLRRAEPSQHWTTRSSSLKFKSHKSASAVTFLCCLANTQVNEPHLYDWRWTNADTLRRVLGPFGSRCFPTFSNFILPALRFHFVFTARRSDPRKMYNKVGLTERITPVSHSGKPCSITGKIKLSLVHLLSQSGLRCER